MEKEEVKTRELDECREEYDLLMDAVKRTQDWRERVLLSHGLLPPTSYYRVLLCLIVSEQSIGHLTMTALAKRVSITEKAMNNIVRRMAYDGVVTLSNDADNRNVKYIALTSEGRAMAIA